jgi:hypothetical protein
MKGFRLSNYRLAMYDSRRRNCRTETTLTPLRRAILIRSRSRLRSSSLVTRYCAAPLIAAGLSDFLLDLASWNGSCPQLHPAQQSFEVTAPFCPSTQAKLDARLLLQMKWLKRLKHAVFKHGIERPVYRKFSLRRRHKSDYSDPALFGSTQPEKRM